MKHFLLLAFFICTFSVVAAQEHDFRLHFGSCHSINRVEEGKADGKIWETIAARGGQGWIWGGDNIYPDSEPATPQNLASVYARMSSFAPYSNFLELIGSENIAGTWDDHDFGINNGGEEYEHRNESMQAHLDFLNVSADDPRRARNGVFNSRYFFDDKIKVILLDNRFNRDDYDDNNGDFLGEEQWNWFQNELNDEMPDSVQTTVIVSGLQMIPEEWTRNFIIENYAKFGESRQRLLDTITSSSARSVVLVSGDVHSTEMSAVRCSSEGNLKEFTIPELTTSGMTHSMKDYPFPFPLVIKYWYKMNKFDYHYQRMYSIERNFGEIDFFFEDNEPRVEIRSLSVDGEVIFEASFPFSDLQEIGDGIAAECSMYTSISRWEKGFRYFFAFAVPVVMLWLLRNIIIMLFNIRRSRGLPNNQEDLDNVSEPDSIEKKL